MKAKIIGSGMCLPPFLVSNETIGNFFPQPPTQSWTPKWVEERLGIKTRVNTFDFNLGVMRSGYYDGDNAFTAATNAIKDAGLEPKDIDRVLYATSTPEYLIPDPACMVHMRLGLRSDVPAVGATSVGCGGFVYIMDIADSEIRSGKYKKILLIGSVSVGPYLQAVNDIEDPKEREEQLLKNIVNAYIFGEGAAALVMEACDESDDLGPGITHTYMGAEGHSNPVIFEAGGSRNPATYQTVKKGLHRFNMSLGLVKLKGPEIFMRVVSEIIKKSGIKLDEIDHFIVHQVNYNLLKAISESLGIPFNKVEVHVDRYGNLDTATLGVAYHELKCSGRLKAGERVLFAAIGAGWQYGAIIMRV
ncbi:MAG: hypothetical protein COU46_01355 [Candidatus Niyogibacteria bacterium CG10_big_fil_rev_8_21_14_0_10_42_19]|uniref:3-oxoacyl-ACP synthase n=1 Tax=Candidatus Niyogibacteria bacterium CG10_big_fil_rev_8_21_14_0_10_42_19 TaxID=1974725 RepID=A0A2H0TFW8_9BACT|nr:MAG: hypothetical protein COU46_01355 [Candidatus Niyogibacteria bacterium CG10_big_fil_rev_8_21_14_0_10_42_19]